MSEIQKRDLDQYQQMAIASCQAWGLDQNIELIRNGENVTYKVTSKGQSYCLRITDEKHRSVGQLVSELDWISYLSNNGVSVAKPIKSLEGELLAPLQSQKQNYFSSVFEWADGDLFKPEANLNVEFISSYGRLVGKIHKLTKAYKADHLPERRKLWEESRHNVHAEKLVGSHNEDMVKYWVEAKAWYDGLEKNKESYWLAHIDLHTGNFHVNNNRNLKVFDFDDSAYCFYVYDIVIPLMSLFSERNDDFPYEKIEEIFLKAYSTENNLSQGWIDRIPSFVRLRNIEMYAWVQFMYGDEKAERHAEYFDKIEESMAQDFKFI